MYVMNLHCHPTKIHFALSEKDYMQSDIQTFGPLPAVPVRSAATASTRGRLLLPFKAWNEYGMVYKSCR